MPASLKLPVEPVQATYGTVSGRSAARITACVSARCSTQASAAPRVTACGRAGRPDWRSRRRPGLRAAQRFELVGEDAALRAPRLLLLTLPGDHIGGRAGDEVLVRQSRREGRELLVEAVELGREPAAFLLHVDGAPQGPEHLPPRPGARVAPPPLPRPPAPPQGFAIRPPPHGF